LQAVDYFTWALQRLYEKKEDRYLSYLQDSIHLVIDIDDKRRHLVIDIDDKRSTKYGVYYSQKKPLNKVALEWRDKTNLPEI